MFERLHRNSTSGRRRSSHHLEAGAGNRVHETAIVAGSVILGIGGGVAVELATHHPEAGGLSGIAILLGGLSLANKFRPDHQ